MNHPTLRLIKAETYELYWPQSGSFCQGSISRIHDNSYLFVAVGGSRWEIDKVPADWNGAKEIEVQAERVE